MQSEKKVTMEFHLSREARNRYHFDDTLFSITGNVILPNFHAARLLAQKMNERRDTAHFPERAVQAGQLNTMGLIDEVLHYVASLYREMHNSQVMNEAGRWLETRFGKDSCDETLRRFVTEFPPGPVYRGEQDVEAYLHGETAGIAHRQLALEEMLLLWLANVNPAFEPFRELFDDTQLEAQAGYRRLIGGLQEFFAEQPPFGLENQNLIEMLRSPAIAVPHSLAGQLAYIIEKWGYLLDKHLYRLLRAVDLLKEEDRPVFTGGPGPSVVYTFAGQEFEQERFSPDQEWMPRLVLMAKNSYVWLDQLARRFRRPVHRLDQVPDEELDQLARAGFTGLWLIGLWERSRASEKIKRQTGNPDAVASAYSLLDYQIAADLGGEPAYQQLKERAWRRGIRLASDMVPNHMGIDSRWVIEHPSWFVSLDHSPFPSYSFNGPNLSDDGRVGIFLEDHYATRTDAAVVFKRVDWQTGRQEFVYHGNDGTNMPWNDTAQLNYLNPEVREAVIQTILHVARKFPIIRFDAAMTLTRKHYQRLWFPEPGTGGAIPSRAEYGLTKDQFDSLMTKEFWREVVDRIAQEVPDTLLLAEAFWMMEGYFVRTLGMHRVYNSAFMNMLKREENANYRGVMKNTLEFNPEILKRFVNFMNNPDEDTAEAQFGKGDKYFGVCTLMVTLPGLPMFGHGQIEGLTEKYGMEFRRALRDEQPDGDLVRRHEREIFPLLRRRYLFAEVTDFLLYDFYTTEGAVNEDVYAYSNRSGNERGLVIYHNRFASTRGWIRTSVAFAGRTGNGEERALLQRDIGAGLGFSSEPDIYCIFRDQVNGLEFLRNSKELVEKGLFLELGAYARHVFLDFREVRDSEWGQYAHLMSYLDGKGVPSIAEALTELFLQPINKPFAAVVNADTFRQLLEASTNLLRGQPIDAVLADIKPKVLRLLQAIQEFNAAPDETPVVLGEIMTRLAAVLRLPLIKESLPWSNVSASGELFAYFQLPWSEERSVWGSLFGWVFIHRLGHLLVSSAATPQRSRTWIDEWLLGRILATALRNLGLDDTQSRQAVLIVKFLTAHQDWFALETAPELRAYQVLETLLRDSDVQQFLQVNRFRDVLWFSKEAFEQLLEWLLVLAVIDSSARKHTSEEDALDEILARYQVIQDMRQAGSESEFQVERLLAAAKSPLGVKPTVESLS